MPFNAGVLSMLLRKGYDRRHEDSLMKAFKEADKNGDGFLSVAEYVQVFRRHGMNISQDEVMMFFQSKDKDRDGRISLEEFCGRETLTERAFRGMDLDKDGFITKAEMLRVSNRGSRRLSASDIEACFHEFDRDKDDRLSYIEFCTMMNSRHRPASSTTAMTTTIAAATGGQNSAKTATATATAGAKKSPAKLSKSSPVARRPAVREEDTVSVMTTDTLLED